MGSGFQDARTAHGVASVCAAVVAVVVAEGVTATIVMSDAEMESTSRTRRETIAGTSATRNDAAR